VISHKDESLLFARLNKLDSLSHSARPYKPAAPQRATTVGKWPAAQYVPKYCSPKIRIMVCAMSVEPSVLSGQVRTPVLLSLGEARGLSVVSVSTDNMPLLLLADQTVQPSSKFGRLRTWRCEGAGL